MNEIDRFNAEVAANIESLGGNLAARKLSHDWIRETAAGRYSYNFRWLGRPIIQFPQDILAVQELIWSIRPDLVIETGIAHGGSLILSASILELIGGDGQVLGIDIDIREHNRTEILNHPLSKRIAMVQGSSIDPEVARKVHDLARRKGTVLLLLDSDHSHGHVLQELRLYTPLVRKGSYCVVFDTIIEDMAGELEYPGRPWGEGNNPKTAVREFLKTCDRFEVDREMEAKLLITVAPEGYLRCIKD